MTIHPGALVQHSHGLSLVVSVAGAALVLAPVFRRRSPAMAGDVMLDARLAAFCGACSVSTARGLEPIGAVSDTILSACQRAARRCNLTAAVVAKYSSTRDWSIEAANERSAVR